jgi:hypothetical protein
MRQDYSVRWGEFFWYVKIEVTNARLYGFGWVCGFCGHVRIGQSRDSPEDLSTVASAVQNREEHILLSGLRIMGLRPENYLTQ